MVENYMVCNCMQVSYVDIANALDTSKHFDDVLSAFEDVQKVTHCSTGCGGCHDKVLQIISDVWWAKINYQGYNFPSQGKNLSFYITIWSSISHFQTKCNKRTVPFSGSKFQILFLFTYTPPLKRNDTPN